MTPGGPLRRWMVSPACKRDVRAVTGLGAIFGAVACARNVGHRGACAAALGQAYELDTGRAWKPDYQREFDGAGAEGAA